LRVYDNSTDADPAVGRVPLPRLVLHMERGMVLHSGVAVVLGGAKFVLRTPDWAKPIVDAALKLSLS
jgi:hypothetical protein